MVISSGMQSMETMRCVYQTVKKHNPNFTFLQCTSAYPLPTEHINLSLISVRTPPPLQLTQPLNTSNFNKRCSFFFFFLINSLASLKVFLNLALINLGISEGVSRHSHRLLWTWDGHPCVCGCCGNGSKGVGASCDPGQDLERQWSCSFIGANWACRTGESHQDCWDGHGFTNQTDAVLWIILP